MLSKIWVFMVTAAVVFGTVTGKINAVASASVEGARAAVELCISITGPIILWSGVMEIISRSGLAAKLTHGLMPALGLVFPALRRRGEIMELIGSNVTANLLGLGNAATPLGLRAAKAIAALSPEGAAASDSLCTLVILNTASIQLIPATIASVRASLGASAPYDILPAVWLSSIAGVVAGLLSARFLALFGRKEA